ncbi:expressed unknown protein [Seminavis robusta]|uniref:RRM domain-containing protein n=1 Tax=Seminavis robusta TaxID=568900 RepID=A0A9N8EHE2_9STRA|nr:expressed unknown protein [Seminavis robusta]|eukprot:Sro1084_g239450.1 n/a (442) ;mRNA; f:5179-6673
MSDEAYLGLGYSSYGHHGDGGAIGGDGMAGGDLLQSLMQQCLSYHEEQQQQQPAPPSRAPSRAPPVLSEERVPNESGFIKGDTYERLVDSVVPPPQWPTSATTLPAPTTTTTTNVNVSGSTPEAAPTNDTNDNSKDPTMTKVEEGRARANAILEKFRRLEQAHGAAAPLTTTSTSGCPLLVNSNNEYRQKRQVCLEQEAQRKKQFWIKNLEYVTKRSQKQLQQQLKQINQAQQWESQVQEQYRLALEARKKRLHSTTTTNTSTTQAGIGTAKRNRVERELQKTTHNHLQQTATIYLTGIPTNGSVPETTIQNLFSSYGTIRKVHYYRDKQTGTLKGDALVVFQSSKNKNEELLQMVCSQMNGAELPCGSILQVQPADSNYQQQQQLLSSYGPPKTGDTSSSNANIRKAPPPDGSKDTETGATKENGDDDDEDLDDFFESLE